MSSEGDLFARLQRTNAHATGLDRATLGTLADLLLAIAKRGVESRPGLRVVVADLKRRRPSVIREAINERNDVVHGRGGGLGPRRARGLLGLMDEVVRDAR